MNARILPLGQLALVGRSDGRVQAWDLLTASSVGPPLRFDRPPADIALDPGGTRALACAGTNEIFGWERPVPWPGDPRRIRIELELMTGMTLDGEATVVIDVKRLHELGRSTSE